MPTVKFAEFELPMGSDASQHLATTTYEAQDFPRRSIHGANAQLVEVYGSGQEFNVSHLNRVKPENHVPNTLIHGVTETFGNNPAHEERAAMSRPPNPRNCSPHLPLM